MKTLRGSDQNISGKLLVLALHQNHYGKTDVLEFVIHKKRSEKIHEPRIPAREQ